METPEKAFMEELIKKMKAMMNEQVVDQDTIRDIERMVVLRVSTKHINLWIRQLEMKREEIGELAGLMGFDEVKKEIGAEKNLEKWAKRATNHLTKKTKRILFEEIDNMVWSGLDEGIEKWRNENKVFDEITDDEIEEIWNREDQGDEPIRLNGKYVWETAKQVCNFINAHEELIQIKSLCDYRMMMNKVMRVIREARNTEKKADITEEKE